jgi:hypothetical protein
VNEDYKALYEQVAPYAAKAKPEDLDAWVYKKTNGQLNSFNQLVAAARDMSGKMSVPETMAHSGLRTATLGFSDELRGAGAALIPGGRGYTEARDFERAQQAKARTDRPGVALASELVGGFATPGLGGLSAARTGLSVARAGALAGGVAGGLMGVGESESTSGALMGGGAGVAAGAVGGAVLSKAFEGLGMLGKWAINKATGKVTPAGLKALESYLIRTGADVTEVKAALAHMESIAPGKAILADVVPGGGRALRAAADLAPELEAQTAAVLDPRSAGQAARVAGALETNMGITGAAARETRQATKAAVRPLADRVYKPLEGQYLTDPNLTTALEHPNTARALKDYGHSPVVLAGQKTVAEALRPVQKVMADITPAIKEGFTYDPRTGQMFSAPKGVQVAVVSTAPVKTEAEVAARISELYAKYGDALANDPSLHIGGYRDAVGLNYIEISKFVPEVDVGVQLGKELGQESVMQHGVPFTDPNFFIPTGGVASTARSAPPIAFEHAQDILRSLRAAATKAFQSADGHRATAAREAAQRVNQGLESASPGFGAANRQYGIASTIGGGGGTKSAFELGGRALDAGQSYEAIREQTAALVAHGGQEAFDAWRMGLVEKVSVQLRRRVTSADVAKGFADMGDETKRIWQLAFPTPDSFSRFEQAMGVEKVMTRTARGAQGGPNTAARMADMGEQLGEAAARGVLPGNVLNVAGTVGRVLVGEAGRKNAVAKARTMGEMLLSNPQQANFLLGQINPALRRGLIPPMLGAAAAGGAVGAVAR